MLVNGYDTRDNTQDNIVVVVSGSISNFIIGGGYLINQHLGGTCADDSSLKTNFSLAIKCTKKMTNLQEQVTIMVRKNGHVYQIKTNSLTLLIAIPYDPTKLNSDAAELIAKANVIDVTTPLKHISVASGATVNVSMKDKGELGSTDLIGFTLWSKAITLLFSSNWDGVRTIKQVLDGGNLAVH